MPWSERLALFDKLIKSESAVAKLKNILLEEENEELRSIKERIENNTIGFDPNPWDNLPTPGSWPALHTVGPTSPTNLASLPNELLQ